MKANIAKMPVRLHIEILLYSGAVASIAMELVDLLRMVNTLETVQKGADARRVSWEFVDAHARPVALPLVSPQWDSVFAPYAGTQPGHHSVTHGTKPVRASFVPPFHTHNIPALRQTVAGLGALSQTVKRELNKGRRMVTLNNGTWFAAATVQAAGRSFAIPWYFTAAFMTDFPMTVPTQVQDAVRDGPFISGGSTGSLAPALLLLLGEVFPVEFINTLRGILLFDPLHNATVVQTRRDGHLSDTRESVISLAVAWLDQRLQEPYDLDALARGCKVSSRTLLRHFAHVMEMTPIQYLHRQRCKRACYLLETTLNSVQSIAMACGYLDATAFRRIFMRHMALAPLKYRQQCGLRAPRARWKVETLEPWHPG